MFLVIETKLLKNHQPLRPVENGWVLKTALIADGGLGMIAVFVPIFGDDQKNYISWWVLYRAPRLGGPVIVAAGFWIISGFSHDLADKVGRMRKFPPRLARAFDKAIRSCADQP